MATVKMTYLSAAERAELAEQTFTVLEEVGVGFHTAEAIDLLATHEVLPIADDVERHIDQVIAGFAAANAHTTSRDARRRTGCPRISTPR